ncbi:sigma factor, partial [Streptomyces griseoloalbus]|uniref:sigma factor n=1 Tax=Streptomyces griseoloalbus TaxID=67303 RepID=UPI00339E847B
MTEHRQKRAGSPAPSEYDPVEDMLHATEAALTQAVSPAETEASLAALKARLRQQAATPVSVADHKTVSATVSSSARAHAQQSAPIAAAPGTTALDVQPPAGGSVRPPAPSTLDELWRSYKATGDERLREQLIQHYSPLVKYVAGRVSVGLPPNVDQADFVSSGVFGLIDAIEKFDVDREIK